MVCSKVFYFFIWYNLLLVLILILRYIDCYTLFFIILRINSKSSNIYFLVCHASYWINDHSNKCSITLLLQFLGGNICARQPTSITRMGMIPSKPFYLIEYPTAEWTLPIFSKYSSVRVISALDYSAN